MVIREDQMAALAESRAADFERDVIAHLRSSFPDWCAGSSDGALLEFVRYGMARARAHGMRAARDVCTYVDLMVLLGRDFEGDPQITWAGERLCDVRRYTDPSARIEQLWSEACERHGRPETGQ
ncbi:MAG: hypothetical protein ABJF23_31130 [Bryobacteraceae bacterium]